MDPIFYQKLTSKLINGTFFKRKSGLRHKNKLTKWLKKTVKTEINK